MTQICVSRLTITGRRQAIIWTNAGILLIRPLGTNFNEILIGNQTFSFKKIHLKMSSAKWRPFCLGLNVLRIWKAYSKIFNLSLILRSQGSTTERNLWLKQTSLRWRHNERDSVSNHQPHDCLLNRLFRRRSKKTSKPRVTGLSEGNSPGTGEFPAQMDSYAENVSIWWRHHVNRQKFVSKMLTTISGLYTTLLHP